MTVKRNTIEDSTLAGFILDQLRGIPNLEIRRMFGGHGLYSGDTFFAILHKERLYFKTGEETRPRYEACGMTPFRPSARQTLRTYYEVPVDILEDDARLTEWAQEAIACQERALAGKPQARRRK